MFKPDKRKLNIDLSLSQKQLEVDQSRGALKIDLGLQLFKRRLFQEGFEDCLCPNDQPAGAGLTRGSLDAEFLENVQELITVSGRVRGDDLDRPCMLERRGTAVTPFMTRLLPENHQRFLHLLGFPAERPIVADRPLPSEFIYCFDELVRKCCK